MSETNSTPKHPLSRRSVLQKGTLLASLGAVGLPAITGTAAATDDCPRSAGYWKTHWPDDYLGNTVDVPPAGTMTKAEIRAVLTARPAGDTVTIMAKQYLATYVNLLQRAGEDPDCADKAVAVDGIGTVEWVKVKNSAQQWLRLNGWDGRPYSGSRSWSPSVDVFGIEGTVDGEALKDALDAFNNAAFDELDCDCDGTEQRNGRTDRGTADRGDSPGRGDGEQGALVDRPDTSSSAPEPGNSHPRLEEATGGSTESDVAALIRALRRWIG